MSAIRSAGLDLFLTHTPLSQFFSFLRKTDDGTGHMSAPYIRKLTHSLRPVDRDDRCLSFFSLCITQYRMDAMVLGVFLRRSQSEFVLDASGEVTGFIL